MRKQKKTKYKRGVIFNRRIELGLKQSEVAKAAGLPTTSYQRIELGLRNPNIQSRYRLSLALKINLIDEKSTFEGLNESLLKYINTCQKS